MNQDTITAIATPPGTGGIAIIRLSGKDAFSIFSRIWTGADINDAKSHTAHLGIIHRYNSVQTIDQAVATKFKAPGSFTGENTVEISCHGSRLIQRQIIHTLIEAGARLANPGEFSRRAFLNGKIDLTQAEAIADLIAAETKAAHDIAITQTKGRLSRQLTEIREKLLHLSSMLELELDFSEEDVEFADRQTLRQTATQLLETIDSLTASYSAGQAMRNGISVAIAGIPNTGKSTLLNHLCDDDKAIVSDIPGTTRDTIEATAEFHGLQFRFIDTAGLRTTNDTIENIGIQRATQSLAKADFTIWLIDPTAPADLQKGTLEKHLGIINTERLHIAFTKSDIIPDPAIPIKQIPETLGLPAIRRHSISPVTGEGISGLISAIAEQATANRDPGQETIIANARHYESLLHSRESLSSMIDSIDNGLPTDLMAADLRTTLTHIGEITGAITTPEILSNIFSNFCIGK